MLLDDPVADREAQARPLADRLGGEERVEDPVAHRGVDAAAGVGDLDPDDLGLGVDVVRTVTVPPSAQASIALVSRFMTTWFTRRRCRSPAAAGSGPSRSVIDFLRAWPTMIAAVDSIPSFRSASLTSPSSRWANSRRWLDDLLDPLEAVARAVEQALDVLQGVGHVDPVAERRGSSPPARARSRAIRSSACS